MTKFNGFSLYTKTLKLFALSDRGGSWEIVEIILCNVEPHHKVQQNQSQTVTDQHNRVS